MYVLWFEIHIDQCCAINEMVSEEKKNQDALFAPEVVRGQGLCRTSSAVAFVRLSQHLLSSLHCCSVCQENGKQENSAWIAFWKNK